ncbi:tetratricopeptide repeat protein [Steroidobacter sp. S1-65]|uniref:Ancillary SecYEG translocon subunit n=1 Tax=Steroidobacter gossypii TaxID=2805490 RepID=A0ABS1WUI6_9GAMM|nr:tetratricopeptide repeat protein [Steroidobacter gossypii]MBM0104624.1 tetratricopeptide repeat protein [Steroidobacter gossypii]
MVDEFLTDRDQEEALRNWWRENWTWILGGIVLGLALLGGWQYWKIHSADQAAAAANLYEEFRGALERNELDAANRSLGTLVADHEDSPYTQHGRLLLAKKHVDAGKFDEALPLLRAVVDTSKDDELAWVARTRVARLLIQQGKHDEALSLLNPEKAGAFAAQVREIRGDAQVAKGNPEAARAEYAAALTANISGAERMIDRNLIEMKLQDVGGDKQAAEPATEPASAQGQP